MKIHTGNAFDLVGERRRMEFKIDTNGKWVDEAFEIKLRNHKKEAVKVAVREHMWGGQWEIVKTSANFTGFTKKDSHTVEVEVNVPAGGDEVTLTYTVRYTW